ncbi:MAG TPA: site-2 protease family protein, partial [Candidatus Brocadiia bacterium]|nr:site-2 protease family protein [Candidatus Brocadiia bacterium]
DEKRTATVTPEPGWDSGVYWRQREYAPSLGPLMALKLGTRKAVLWVARVYSTLQAFVTGRVASKHLGGPIAIARITYAAATIGVSKLLYYLGMISLNLGLLNLLPIPVMDGGHLVFAAVEKARRKPVSERVQTGASYVGLAVLLALALFTTWNDVWRLITGG